MTNNDNFYESKEFQDKLKLYKKAHKKGEPIYLDPEDFTDISDYYISNNEEEEAECVIADGLSLHPKADDLWINAAALSLMNHKDADRARYCLDKIEDKTSSRYILLLGEIMLLEEKIDEANQLFYHYVEKVEDEDVQYFQYIVSSLYTEYGYFKEAKQWFSKLPAFDDEEYQDLKGRIALGNEEYDEGERIYQALLDKNPYSGDYWGKLASTQLIKENFQEAINSCDFALAINPNDADAIVTKANAFFKLENYEKALQYYLQYKKINTTDSDCYGLIAMAYIQTNQPKQAIAYIKKVEKNSINNQIDLLLFYQEAVSTFSMLGYLNEALTYIRKMQALRTCNPINLFLQKGNILFRKGEVEKANKEFQKAIKIADNKAYPIIYKAVSALNCGYTEMAYYILKDFLSKVDDTWIDGYAYFALCCKKLQKEDEFINAVQQACKKNPEEAFNALEYLFPEGMNPEDYYSYLCTNNKNN